MISEVTQERSFASFYDFYDAAEYREDQLEAYVRLARDASGPVLELACGTGVIALELARQGVRVTGLDISSSMLDVFRGKLEMEEQVVRDRVTLVQGDMKDLWNLGLSEQFGTVFVANNSFGYLTSTDAQKQCLVAANGLLVTGGIVVIEERFYSPDVLVGMLSRRAVPMVQMARINPGTGKFTSFHSMTVHIDFAGQTVTGRRFIEEVQRDGTVHRIVPEDGGRTQSHFFGRFELQLLLEQGGFEVLYLWGSYDRQPFTGSSRSMIFVGKKP